MTLLNKGKKPHPTPNSFVAPHRALIRKHFKLVEEKKYYKIYFLFVFYHAHTKRVAAATNRFKLYHFSKRHP